MELSVKKAVGYLPRLMGGSSTTLVDSAPFFYGSELWSDVRIVCRDGIVKDAHRLILGAVCPNLRLALDQLDCCCEEKAVLIMQDFPAEEVVQFLQVLYGREADIPEKQQLGLGGLFRAVGCSKLSPTWQAVSGEQLSESSAVKMEEFDQKEEEMRFVEIKAPKRTRKTKANILESHEEDEVFETIESVEVKLEDVGMESIVTDVEEETDTKENTFSKRTKQQSSSGSEAKKSKVLLDLRSLSRDRKVTCPLCDKTGLSEKRFKEHALKVHPEEERPEELINDDESEPDPLDLGESETVQGSSWKCGVMNCDFLFGEEGGDRAAALAASQAHLSSVHGYRGCPSCNLLMPRYESTRAV